MKQKSGDAAAKPNELTKLKKRATGTFFAGRTAHVLTRLPLTAEMVRLIGPQAHTNFGSTQPFLIYEKVVRTCSRAESPIIHIGMVAFVGP